MTPGELLTFRLGVSQEKIRATVPVISCGNQREISVQTELLITKRNLSFSIPFKKKKKKKEEFLLEFTSLLNGYYISYTEGKSGLLNSPRKYPGNARERKAERKWRRKRCTCSAGRAGDAPEVASRLSRFIRVVITNCPERHTTSTKIPAAPAVPHRRRSRRKCPCRYGKWRERELRKASRASVVGLHSRSSMTPFKVANSLSRLCTKNA